MASSLGGSGRACECGEPNASDCRTAFDAALAAEFGDPAYFGVHHLTVAAYQAQHPGAHPPRGAVEVLGRFLDEGVTPQHMRREIVGGRVEFESETNTATTGDGVMRMSSVRLGDPVVYCSDVERYARSVLAAAKGKRPTTEPDR